MVASPAWLSQNYLYLQAAFGFGGGRTTRLCSQPALSQQSYQILTINLVLLTKQPVSSPSAGGLSWHRGRWATQTPMAEGRKQALHCCETQQQPRLAPCWAQGKLRGITTMSPTQAPPWPWDVPRGSWSLESAALTSCRQLQSLRG